MKHSKYIIYLSVFLYLFSYSYAQSPVKIDSGLQTRVQDIIKKADTYYKLSRIRNNDLIDIDKSISFFKQAEAIVQQNSKVFSRNNLKEKIQNGLEMLYAQKKKSGDKIKNYFPLYSILFGQDQLIHYFGNGHDTALENSLSDILASDVAENILPIAYSIDNNYLIEEVARNYFSKNSDIHLIGHHELSDVLTKSEIGLLYKLEPDQRILDKISDWIGQEGVGLLNLNVVDITDNLFHANSTYRFWNSKKKVYQNEISGEAYSESPNSGLFWLILLLFLGLPMTIIYNKITTSHGSDAPFWYGSFVALSTFITSLITIRGLSILAIDGTILVWSPKGMGTLLLLTIFLSLLPLALNYVGSARVNHISKVLNNPETISSLVFGTFLGVITFLSVASNTRLGIENTLAVFIPSITAIAFLSFFLGMAYSKWTMRGEKESFVKYILFLFLLFCFSIFVLRWNQQLMLDLSFGLVLSTIIVELFPKVLIFIPKLKNSKKQESIKDKEDAGIVDLREKLKEPKFVNIIGKEKLESIKSFVLDRLKDKKIEVVFIEAKTGMGKTRLAREIAKEVKEEFKNDGYETRILFGDCDDPQYDADLMPYEPFSQALSDELQVNRFSNPSKKAEELRSSAAGKVIGKLAKGSLGPLGVLLDAEEDNQSVKADTNEIAITISKVLAQISDGNKKVIFIIDDTQWMDEDSFSLLELIIETLSTDLDFKAKNKVSFIFTSRPVSENNKIKKFLKNSNEINVNDSINQESFRNNKIVDGIIDSLNFDFQSKQKLVNYFNNLGIESPLQILQALDTVVEKKMIEIYANKFILIKSADLKTLPKPDDYNRMVDGLLEGLDPRLLDSLQCAAVIGRSFKASIIAEIFKLDILEFLVMLKGAEERNILKDISEKDDIYEFVQKRMVGIFRNLRKRSDDNDFMPQMVREYHKRFVEIREKYNKKNKIALNTISYRDTLSMATHSKAIADVFPDRALDYNSLAANQAYKKGLFSIANKFFRNCLDIMEKYNTDIDDTEYLAIFISFAKCLIDEESDIEEAKKIIQRGYKIIDKAGENVKSNFSRLELMLLDSLIFFRSRQSSDAMKTAQDVLTFNCTVTQQLRAKFYIAISLDTEKLEERKKLHLEVVNNAESLLKKNELNPEEIIQVYKVLSEVYNNIGFVFLYGLKKPEDAREYFNQAIKINEIPEVNDQKGIAIAHTGLGTICEQLGDLEKAGEHYNENLRISKNNGDKKGIVISTSKLGHIHHRLIETSKDSDSRVTNLKQGRKYYNQSLFIAEGQKNGTSILFALSGLLENFILSESYEECEKIFNKIDENQESIEKNAIQFSKDAVDASLDKLKQEVQKNQFDSEIKKVKNILLKQPENKG